MSEGFKKYFNSTTVNGRANVAKATYGAVALLYLIYRVRRGKGQATAPVSGDCVCSDGHPSDRAISESPNHDCAVCRERKAKDDHGHGKCDEPPPPPSSGAAGAPPRRKCPCDDPHRHSDSGKQHSQRHDEHHEPKHSEYAHQQQSEMEAQPNYNPTTLDEVRPARELISQMQGTASRVLRSVIGAVIGGNSAVADNVGANDGEECCSCCTPSDNLNHVEPLEDEACDYGADSQSINRQRRTAPRSCVPSNTSNDPGLVSQLKQPTKEELEPKIPIYNSNNNNTNTTTTNNYNNSRQSRYRCFEDDFSSEMFFTDYEE